MKKILILFLSLFIIGTGAQAGNDTPIEYSQLPQAARLFIEKHFEGNPVALTKMETEFLDKSYEVIFTNGDKVEFDKKGEWTDVDCRRTTLPAEIVPVKIRDYVSKNYPQERIIKIERKKRKEYEVELSNKLELTFNSRFNLTDIDD